MCTRPGGYSPGVNSSLAYPTDRLFELYLSSVVGGEQWHYGSGRFRPSKNQLSSATEVGKKSAK